MWIDSRLPAVLLTALAAACSGKSSEFSGSGGSGASGHGTGGSNASGGTSDTGGTSGNASGFCVLGAQGCPCDATGSCARGLTCESGTCCDDATGSCAVPPSQGSTGTSAGGGTATGGSSSGGPKDPGGPKNPGSAGAAATSVCTPGVVGPVITDCGYPYASDNPLTSVEFNESDVLRAIAPSGGAPIGSVRLFYNDEHALTLGVRSVIVKSSSGSVTHAFPVSELTDNPGSVRSPRTGTNDLVGDDAGTDPVGRPMWPALFVTDTTADANSRSGDWQMGGTAWNPSVVFGTWKAAERSVDTTVSPNVSSVTPDADPAKNDWNLGGGDALPASLSSSTSMPPPKMGMMGTGMMSGPSDEGYGAEVRWDLVLVPGHSYRIQVMVHDGDQNKVGGDSGEACVNFCAAAACPDDSLPCSDTSPCPVETESICVNGCCL